MTEIFLYERVGNRESFLEFLLRTKILPSGRRAVVLAADLSQAAQIDAMLWSRTQESFLPHCAADSELAGQTPVLIAAATSQENPPVAPIMINCCLDVPEVFASYERLVEILPGALADDLKAQERVKEYENRGHNVRVINIR